MTCTQAFQNETSAAMGDGGLEGKDQEGSESSDRIASRILLSEDPEESAVQDDNTSPNEEGVQQYIRKLSSVLSHPRERSINEPLLTSVVREAGEFSYGIEAVEVYSFQDPRLLPVGWWQSSDMPPSDREYITQPEISIPGIDLIGWLWSEQHSSFALLVNRSWSASFRQKKEEDPRPALPLRSGLCWRDLKSLIENPDAIHGPRLEALSDVGLEKATGVEFDTHGHRGMVVYYAKMGVDPDVLTGVANETYLRRAASSIGAVLAMTEARRDPDVFQPLVTFNLADTKEASEQVTRTCRERTGKRILAWYEKCWGGGSQIPPGMSFDEALWTIFGVFIGLLTVSLIDKLFQSSSDQFLILGPFGALVTLQYGLSGAPASQPRNVVLGHIIAIAVSLGFTYITAMPTWIRQILAPALSIGIMAKLGITHPPAGAQSVIFAEGGHGWTSFALVILCSVISLIPATVINNMSQKRQYPTYWGYIPAYLSRTCSRERRKRANEH